MIRVHYISGLLISQHLIPIYTATPAYIPDRTPHRVVSCPLHGFGFHGRLELFCLFLWVFDVIGGTFFEFAILGWTFKIENGRIHIIDLQWRWDMGYERNAALSCSRDSIGVKLFLADFMGKQRDTAAKKMVRNERKLVQE